MSLAAISKHLKVLQGAGLVSRARDAQWRPCQLEPRPLAEVYGWLEDYKRLWERNLDSLGEYLKTVPRKKTRKHK